LPYKKKRFVVIEWNSEVADAHGDLAYMKFNMLSEKEKEYQCIEKCIKSLLID
jgi:hypothetical protein